MLQPPHETSKRVEVMFRLKDASLCRQICGTILAPYLADTAKSRVLGADGAYTRTFRAGSATTSRNGGRFGAQDFFINLAENSPERERSIVRSYLSKLPSSPAIEFLSRASDAVTTP